MANESEIVDVPGVGVVPGSLKTDLAAPKSFEDFQALEPGTRYTDPEGKPRIKPWSAKTIEDFKSVPEGAQYLDPEGQLREKPTYKDVGFTASMLYDMALTDEGKEKALETVYPGKVKKGLDGLYVEDEEGVLRRPGRGVKGALGQSAASAAPAIGMTAGMLAGGAGGTLLEPGGGTVAGGVGGAVLGAMAGRQFNNVLLSLAGIHESPEKQIESMGWEGAAVAGGEVIGRGIAKIPGAMQTAKEGAQAVGSKLGGVRENLSGLLESLGITPSRARYFLGTTPEMAERAAGITARGGRVPPSVLAPEAPMLRKIEEFDAVFRAQNVFGEAARDYYEIEGKRLLEGPELGLKLDTLLTRAEKKVSSEKAGQLALGAVRRDMAHDDAMLEKTWREARMMQGSDQIAGMKYVYEQKMQALTEAQKKASETAGKFVDSALKDIEGSTAAAMKELGADENPGALWRMTGAKLHGYNQAVRARARTLYNASDAAGGQMEMPDSGMVLGGYAQEFLSRMPDAVKGKYPQEIADIAKLAGRAADPDNKIEALAPKDLTFKELRLLRSWLRHGVDWSDLTPDMRAGSLKLFETKVNSFLHDRKLPAQFQHATQMLDTADAFYKEKIPFLHDSMVKTVLTGLEAGVPANPDVLAKVLFDPGRVEAMRKARSIIGEPMWRQVQAAHAQDIINQSRTINIDEINGKRFADQVEGMVRNGLLTNAYDKEFSNKLLSAAKNVRTLEGAVPVRATDTDSLSSLMRKTELAVNEIKQLADNDPIKALATETKRIDKQFADVAKLARTDRRSEPLHFLYEDSMSAMAVRAADRILGSQDLIGAAAQKFGRESSEFKALQQVYVNRFFQRPLGETGKMFGQLGGEKGMTEEVQALMFPGVSRSHMLQLAKDMEFLFSGGGSDVGGSLAAASRVINPWSHIPIPKTGGMASFLIHTPGTAFIARFTLQKAFATVMDGVSHPNFINWLAADLSKGTTERATAKAVLQQRLMLGGWMGAATGEFTYEQNK